MSYNEAILHHVPNRETVVFRKGRESVTGYALVQKGTKIEIIVPAGVKKFAPLTFLLFSPAQATITFLGDAPAIVEDEDILWIEDVIIRYNLAKTGGESFAWKGKFEM